MSSKQLVILGSRLKIDSQPPSWIHLKNIMLSKESKLPSSENSEKLKIPNVYQRRIDLKNCSTVTIIQELNYIYIYIYTLDTYIQWIHIYIGYKLQWIYIYI